MAAADVISNATDTLVGVLQHHLGSAPGAATVVVDDLIDDPSGTDPLVSVFLWDIVEDPTVRNRAPKRQANANGTDWTVFPADLGLALHYMITAWSFSDRTKQASDEQKLLGKVAECFHLNAILTGPVLKGDLSGTDSALAISMMTVSLDDRNRLWSMLKPRFRVSLYYEVRVVNMPFTNSTTVKAVQERVLTPVESRPS